MIYCIVKGGDYFKKLAQTHGLCLNRSGSKRFEFTS